MAVKIRKKDTARWVVDISYNNKQRRIVVGSKRQAISLKDEIELEIARGKLGFIETRREKVTFNKVAQDWFIEHHNNVKESTRERYETILRLYLKPHFGRKDIRDIKRADILTFLRDKIRKGKSVSVVGVMSSVLGQVFLFALDMEIIETNPTNNISRSLKLKKNRNTDEPFTPSELEQLLDAAPPEYKLFFLFAFRTGCRLGECLGLHWDDIQGHQVTIRRTCNRRRIGTPKNGSERTIDLSEQLVKELNQARSEERVKCVKSGRKPKIVFNKDGNYLANQTVRRIWIQMLEKAEIPYKKFHNIRHSVASLLIDAGVNPSAVQHQLGHHSAQFTLDVYSKRIKKKEAITNVLDSGFFQEMK